MLLLNTKIDSLTKKEAEEKVSQFLQSSDKHYICTVNPEILIQSQNNKDLKKALDQSSLNTADGIGLLWAAKFLSLNTTQIPILREVIILLQWITTILMIPFAPSFFKKPIPERISGSDFIYSITKIANQEHKTIYLLGGAPTIPERAALQLKTEQIGLKIVGTDSSRANETEKIVKNINDSKADIVLVGFGAPKQEVWLFENLEKTNCRLGMVVGGTFDFLAGIKKRAPRWIQKIGLEWLYRLIKEPKRITRQFSIPFFMILILFDKLLHCKQANYS